MSNGGGNYNDNSWFDPHRDAFPGFKIPHFAIEIPKGYKQWRSGINKKYSYITLWSSIIIILYLAFTNFIFKKYYYRFSRLYKSLHHSHRKWYSTFANNKVLQYCIFWTLYTMLIVLPEARRDLLIITKRLGRVAITLMPTLFFLTLRPSPLPRMLYLTLIPLHKWISRIVILQSLLHTIFYCIFYCISGKTRKIFDPLQICGWIPMIGFTIIAITSLHPIRRANFPIFYINHYFLSWVSVLFLYFHSRPSAKIATFLNVFILSWQMFLRFTNTSIVKIHVQFMAPNLKIIEVSKSKIPKGKFQFKHSITPCSHLRIQKKFNNPIENIWYRFFVPLAHPYTIASLPSDKSLILVVRNTKFDFNDLDDYYITGSYDSELDFLEVSNRGDILGLPETKRGILSFFKESPLRQPLLNTKNIITLASHYNISASRVLMIIGGSGIAVALPILRVLNIQGIPSKIMWVIKDIQDLKLLKHFKNIDINSIEVYLTSKTYKFEHLTEDILQIDDLLIDQMEEIPENNNNDWDEDESEIDFTNFGVSDNENSFASVPIAKKKVRSKSLSSIDTPPSISSSTNRRISTKKSFKEILIAKLNLDAKFDQDDDDDIQGTNADDVKINISRNFKNYDTKVFEHQLNKSKSVSQDLFNNSGGLSSTNYGSINNNRESSRRSSSKIWKTNKEFKVPLIINTDANGRYSSMIKHLKIYKGRPVLGQDEFNWCLNHICGDQNESSSSSSVEISFESNSSIHHFHGNNLDHQHLNCCNDVDCENLDDILKKVWVMGVGPEGLTKKAAIWARENRLNYQEESFTV